MADPDLQIKGWGGGAVIQTLSRGGGGLKNFFFRPFGPQVGLRIRFGAGGGSPGPLP